MTLCKTVSLSLTLALTLGAATAQGPIPSWLRAPGAAGRFQPDTTTWNSGNAFLAMTHAVLSGPTDIGFTSWQDTAAQRTSYENRMRSILLGTGTATYGSGASAVTAAGWGYTAVTFFRSTLTDAEGYIASNDTHTIISFRGSELSDMRSFLQDWLQTDLNFAPVTLIGSDLLPAGSVHAGFLAAVLSVKQQIVQQLQDFHGYRTRFAVVNGRLTQIRPTKPIWTTGYSLGGACATVSAFLLARQDGLPVRGTITGGAPMVGNTTFGNSFLNAGLQIYRHENNCEIIPLAPGELARLPGDMTGTVERVGNWVASLFVEPVRTPMNLLVAAMLAPANWVAGNVSTINELAAAANANYVHFGEMRYFDRNEVVSLNPSANTRQNDREITFANGAINVLAQFVPPPPPSNPYDVVAWSIYTSQLASIAGNLWNAVWNPQSYIDALAATFGQYQSDHSAVKQARLQFDVMPLALRTSASMPNRP